MRLINLISIASIAAASPMALSNAYTQFSDSVINLVYSFNPTEQTDKHTDLQPYFTQASLDNFIKSYSNSKLEQNAISKNYTITSYLSSPTKIVESSTNSFKTVSFLNVFYTNDNEQITIPTQVYINAEKSEKGIKVVQFYSKTTGEPIQDSAKLNRYKQCNSIKSNENKT
jgi:hypothetical protein